MSLFGSKRQSSARNTPMPRRSSSSRQQGEKGSGPVRRLVSRLKGLLLPRKASGAERKPASPFWGGVRAAFILGSLILLIGGGVFGVFQGTLWLYGQAERSDFFTTRHIDISGNVRLERDAVLEFAGLREGDNSLAVGIGDIERRLLATPWVEEVSVKRLLPDRFVIRLKERMPSFWVRKDKVLYYANERGEIIAPVESRNFLSLPTLHLEPDTEDALPYLANLMADMRNGGLPVEAGAIASVSVSAANGIEVFLEDRELRLSIATGDWSGNIARLGATINDLARRHELRYVRVVRASDNSVWVQLNRSAG